MGACRFGDAVELLPDELGVGGFQPVQFHGIAVRAVLVELDPGLEMLQILADTPYQVVVPFHLLRDLLQLVAARRLAAHERLPFAFERGDLLFQSCLVQQVGISRERGDVLGEVHAALLVDASLVDGTATHVVGLELPDKELLVVQQPELVGVERLLDGVEDHVHLVAGMELGDLVPGAYSPPVALLQVAGAPGAVEVVYRHAPPLGVHARPEHLGRAEQHADSPGVHAGDHLLARLLRGRLLDEAYLAWGDAVILRELAPYLGVDVPLGAGLVGSQVGEDELRAFLFVVTAVVVRDHAGAMAGLVVHVVAVQIGVYHAHIEGHLAGVVGGDEHFGLLLPLRERQPPQEGGVARLGELHQPLDELRLLGCRRDAVQDLVLLRAVDPYILRRAVVGDLGVEEGQLGNLDEVPETLFLHDLVGHGELVVDVLLGEDRRPGVEGADILPLQLSRAQVLEKQVQLRERVGDGRAREERRPQVAARALLDGA